MTLLAILDFELILKGILVTAGLVAYILNQLVGKKVAPPSPRPPKAPPPVPNEAIRDGDLQSPEVRNEVEAFLRRVANQPPKPPAGSGRPPRKPVKTIAKAAAPAQRKPDPAAKSVPRLESVDAYVRERMDTSSFQERAQHLGETVEKVDSQMEAHMRSAFDRKWGALAGQTAATSEASNVPASSATATPLAKDLLTNPGAALARLLADPDSRRNAAMLNEIFTRPIDRW
ncbi:MAG TPA: hypothetical protein VFE24_12705 [Pirellulales bacterium]|jgi:hypothetical protein|nr:hypothetical protein [Pirellulales bacterium]